MTRKCDENQDHTCLYDAAFDFYMRHKLSIFGTCHFSKLSHVKYNSNGRLHNVYNDNTIAVLLRDIHTRQGCENILHIDRTVISMVKTFTRHAFMWWYEEVFMLWRRSWIVRFIFKRYCLRSILRNLQFHCHQIIIANAVVNGNLAGADVLAAIATATAAVARCKHKSGYWLSFQWICCVCVCVRSFVLFVCAFMWLPLCRYHTSIPSKNTHRKS